MAKSKASKKKVKEREITGYNSVQGKLIPEKLTRKFVDSLDIESMTKREIDNLINYSIVQAAQGKHGEMLKNVAALGLKNKHLGAKAHVVELALSE